MYVELSAFSYELPSVSITPCLHWSSSCLFW
jgi:hypothetical protein